MCILDRHIDGSIGKRCCTHTYYCSLGLPLVEEEVLDPLNCTEVRSVPSLNHPSAREDVGTIAACAQIAKGNCPPLMELLCPFQLLYTDDVKRLAAESARERVCWVGTI